MPEALRESLQADADRAGMKLSEYARRRLSSASPMAAMEQRLGQELTQLKSKLGQVEAKLDYLIESLYASTLADAPPIGTTQAVVAALPHLAPAAAFADRVRADDAATERPKIWSSQHRQMVEVDADGREIPP